MANPERLFICRLALALGKSLSEIASMPMQEMIIWAAFYQLEPWGCPVEDQRSAHMLNLFYQANSKPGTPVPTFYNRWPEETQDEEPQSENNLHIKVKGFFSAYTDHQKKAKVS